MPIRVTGMVSGLDTESIISALVSSYSTKKDKVVKSQTKLSWTQEAWKGINTKVYGLYTDMSSLRFSSAYNLKTTSISDGSKAKVVASNDAVVGTQTLEIKSLAKAAYLTGGKINSKDAKDTLGSLGYKGKEAKISLKTADGIKEIKVSKDTTLNEVVGQFRDAGLNASFDAKNQRFFVSAKDSGAAGDFTIEGQDDDANSALAFLGLGGVASPDSESAKIAAFGKYKTDANGVETYDRDETVKDIVKILENLKNNAEKKIRNDESISYLTSQKSELETAKTKLEEEKAKLEEELAAIDPLDTTAIADKEAELAAKETELADNASAISTNQTKLDGFTTANEDIDKYAKDYEHFAQDDYSTMNIPQLANEFADEIETAHSIASGKTALGDSPVMIKGTDAKIILNNAEFVSNTNTFSINGLTIEATGLTKEGEPISISTSVDSQGLYDKIKDFLGKYNDVINEITKIYNADSAKGYEPLTEDEKAAMSDKEIEKWEAKVKDSLLRRDTTLGSVMSAMTSAMGKVFEINGEKVSLSTFGIQTLGFLQAEKNEQYAFHIDGDSEDKKTEGKTDKLMAAITEDPEKVSEFMKQLVAGLYNDLGDKMKSTNLSSVYTIYNDKEMASEYSSYNTTIKEWEKKLTDMEDKYYKKFSAMESSLSKLQSSTTSLTGLMG